MLNEADVVVHQRFLGRDCLEEEEVHLCTNDVAGRSKHDGHFRKDMFG